MNFKDITKQVTYLEDRIIYNFDKHFSQLILYDFYDGGWRGRLEDSLFYEEYFSEYESEIIDLLFEISDEFNAEYSDLKLRLIKMKRIIDTNMAMVKNEDDIDIDSLHTKRKNNRSSIFLLKQNMDNEKFIEFLYNQLTKNKLIDTNIEVFKTHFSNKWENKIQWLGTELQLTNLITLLIENEYLDFETRKFKYKLIALHFVNKKGNPFVEKQLGAVFADKKDSMFNDITNSIMDEISTNF